MVLYVLSAPLNANGTTFNQERLLSAKQIDCCIDRSWPISDRLAAPNRSFRSKLPKLTVLI
jgi:hypothetical protein